MNSSISYELNQMPKELTLLIAILKTSNGDKNFFTNNELLMDVNWYHFLQLTMYHRVHPVIYVNLKDLDEKYIPPFVIQTLYQEYKKNTFQMLKLSGEMGNISELFMENNIRSLFLKGPVLALDLYGDVSLRTSRDLDILIPINNLDQAEEVLFNSGYKRQGEPIPFWKIRKHHVTYFHPYKRIVLEIHWRLQPQAVNEPTFEDLWNRKRAKNLASYPTYFLGKEDLFLYLIAHGARHGWFRLRWLLDINQVLWNQMNEEGKSDTLNGYQYRHFGWGTDYLGQALILVSMLFHTSLDNGLQSVAEKNGSRKLAEKTLMHLSRQAQSNLIISGEYPDKYEKRYIFSIKPNLQKAIFVLQQLLPDPEDAEVLPLPKFLRLLYIPLHPFLWAWRKIRKISK